MGFKQINANEITKNPIDLIGKDWTLVTAGNKDRFNSLTASWGGLGFMWNKPVVFTFIRPQRYTFDFIENSVYYTMSFFDESYRDALKFFGTESGRDYDKAKETGLTPVTDENCAYYNEAKLVIICKKMYGQFLNEESIIDSSIMNSYAAKDFHKMYVGEIVKVLVKE